jgi:outer membrane protein assembly factor BamB
LLNPATAAPPNYKEKTMKLLPASLHGLLFCSVLLFLAVPVTMAEQSAHIVRSKEAGWPQFRGPARDGISLETGLLKAWPAEGPGLLWRVSDLGDSYSSPIITEQGIFITGDVDDDLVISAFELDGALLWKAKNGKAWKRSYPGARASCTYDGGRLFHMNAHGRVVRLDPKTGDEQWAVNVLERFDGENIEWGLSESVLVDGDRVFVTPGGKKAFMAALDADTGATVWASDALHYRKTYGRGGKPLDTPEDAIDHAGYTPPILFEIGGRRIIARGAGHHVICVDAKDGSTLWLQPVPAAYAVIGTTPVLWKDRLIFAAAGEFGTTMFRIRADEESVHMEKLWQSPLDNCHGGLVLSDGRLYGSGYSVLKDWLCIDAVTGETLYSRDDLAQGATLFADGHLYALSENGVLSLLKPTDDGFQTAGQLRIGDGKQKDVWTHPVICDGRLYVRDHGQMWCYDIKAR